MSTLPHPPLLAQDRPVGRRDRLVAALLGVTTFVVLVAVQPRQGVSRDEAYYFKAGEQYYGWFENLAKNIRKGTPGRSFSRAEIDRFFAYNHEHPPVAKVLFGLSWRLLHRCNCSTKHATIPLASHITAHRLPTCALSGLLTALVYLLGVRLISRRGALVAAVLTVAMPHPFFHAQIAAFDQPVNVFWFATAYAYYRSLRSPRWGIFAALLLGVALGTKHNAWFLPPLVGVHYVACAVLSWRRGHRLPSPSFIPAMALLGPLVFWVLWPWMWHSSWPRFLEYVRFHLHHVYYNIEYLGKNWNVPPFPWHYPLVVTALTVPVTTLVLALAGGVLIVRERLLRGQRHAPHVAASSSGPTEHHPTDLPADLPKDEPLACPGLFLALLALFPLALFMTGRTPIFGGMKHFITAMPILALLAGVGFEAAARALGPWVASALRFRRSLHARSEATEQGLPRGMAAPRPGTLATAALGILICLPAVLETARSHPYGLSHYNLLAGGPAGGASLGMNRQFWGYAPRGLFDWMNRTLERGARLYPHDMNTDSIIYYKRDGLLRRDIADVWQLEEPGMRLSNWALVIHEKHFNRYDPAIWEIYGTLRPVRVLDHEGVPLVSVYRRERR